MSFILILLVVMQLDERKFACFTAEESNHLKALNEFVARSVEADNCCGVLLAKANMGWIADLRNAMNFDLSVAKTTLLSTEISPTFNWRGNIDIVKTEYRSELKRVGYNFAEYDNTVNEFVAAMSALVDPKTSLGCQADYSEWLRTTTNVEPARLKKAKACASKFKRQQAKLNEVFNTQFPLARPLRFDYERFQSTGMRFSGPTGDAHTAHAILIKYYAYLSKFTQCAKKFVANREALLKFLLGKGVVAASLPGKKNSIICPSLEEFVPPPISKDE